MATAYTIRYGKEKAAAGPGVSALVSQSFLFGVDVGAIESLLDCVINGGGSITVDVVFALTAGSGSEGIESSAEDESIVMCLVGGAGLLLMLYRTGEHLTTTDGFL